MKLTLANRLTLVHTVSTVWPQRGKLLAIREAGRGWFVSVLAVSVAVLLLAVTSGNAGLAGAGEVDSQVLPKGKRPQDRRLLPLKDLNGYFPFQPPQSVREWEQRRESVLRRLQVSQGLWPRPTDVELNAVIHGRRVMDDYTVEKVYFQTAPGFFTTGSLYRPRRLTGNGQHAAVLSPHGHWSQGRFYDAGLAKAKSEIKSGAEVEISAARYPLQARCVHLARMGCVVFHYDMIGYADSKQISYELAHRFAKQRPEMNASRNWGLFSPQAETNLQSVMGLQSYSSLRALDFVLSLPEVDAKRIAVTGASGGGTQTFMLSALAKDRVRVSVPAVMVSTAMQGGCTCENAALLRVGTGNVELAGIFAPQPQMLLAANDWTKEMATKGFPDLKKLYSLLGAADKVQLNPFVQFPHNYNGVSRHAMYGWMNQHLNLQADKNLQERPFTPLTARELTVWGEGHPQPAGGADFERQLLRWWANDSRQQLRDLIPTNAKQLRRFKEVVGGGIDTVVGRELPASKDIDYEQTEKLDRGSYLLIKGLLKHRGYGEELPTVFLYPKSWNKKSSDLGEQDRQVAPLGW